MERVVREEYEWDREVQCKRDRWRLSLAGKKSTGGAWGLHIEPPTRINVLGTRVCICTEFALHT